MRAAFCSALLVFFGLFTSTTTAQVEEFFVIDFEGFAEGTEIDDEYVSIGATFSMQGGGLPVVCVEGLPVVGFNGTGPDSPVASGTCALTDPLAPGPFNSPDNIVIEFDPPVTGVTLFVMDLDANDSVTLRAFDGLTEVDAHTRSAGQPGTGDGVSTDFAVDFPTITSVVVEISGDPDIGWAIDFVTFTRPCSPGACLDLVLVSQETAPGAGDFEIAGWLQPVPIAESAASFYAYDVPEGDSWNGPLVLEADRTIFFVADTTDGRSLFVVHDRAIPNDANGGDAEMSFEVFGDPDGLVRTVEDDPPGTKVGAGYTGDPGDSYFTSAHLWDVCCTDGLVLSGLDGEWSMIIQFTDVDGNPGNQVIAGLNEWAAWSAGGHFVPLALEADRRVLIELVTPHTGCTADWNLDGLVNTSDFIAYLNDFVAVTSGNPPVFRDPDLVDPVGTVNTSDFIAFLNAFNLGCP